MININDDVSALTTIPVQTLNKLSAKQEQCIAHAVYETKIKHDEISEIDVGYGTIHICISEDEIKYRFTPSNSLETLIVKAIKNDKSPLVTAIEDRLREKILNVYKEMF